MVREKPSDTSVGMEIDTSRCRAFVTLNVEKGKTTDPQGNVWHAVIVHAEGWLKLQNAAAKQGHTKKHLLTSPPE